MLTPNFAPAITRSIWRGLATELAREIAFSVLTSVTPTLESSGYGKFHVVDKIYLNEPLDDQTEWMYHALSAEHAPYLLLSTSLPQTDELDNALEGASFQLVRRSGFMASDRVETPLKKKTQYALSAGSVLQNRYQCALYDVGLSDVHPVYRYSKPIFMGVTL